METRSKKRKVECAEIISAVTEKNLDKLKKCKPNLEKYINSLTDENDNPILHLAVIKVVAPRSVDILKYLLSVPNVNVNIRDAYKRTPLAAAICKNSNEDTGNLIESIRKLIEHNVDINAEDLLGNTPLHLAVKAENLELISLLLYYNASTTIKNCKGYTAFETALSEYPQRRDIQEALMHYVGNFNEYICEQEFSEETILSLAVKHNSPLLEEMIKKGGDVNYAVSTCDVFLTSLECSDLDTIKIVIKYLKAQRDPSCSVLVKSIEFGFLEVEQLSPVLTAIMESDNFKEIVKSLNFYHDLHKFMYNFFTYYDEVTKIEKLEIMTKLISALLDHNYSFCTMDLEGIFFEFGYCKLFKKLLLSDVHYCSVFSYEEVGLVHLLYDVRKVNEILGDFCNTLNIKWDYYTQAYEKNVEELLKYTIYPYMVEIYNYGIEFDELDKPQKRSLPCLVDLARNKARDHIIDYYKVKTCKEFYTILNDSDLSSIYKKLLSFEIKLYDKKSANLEDEKED